MPELPPGPALPPALQTLALARDPIGVLLRLRARHGPVFSLRLAGIGPVVVVGDPAAVATLVPSDPEGSHAGEARRAVLPQASPRSSFGSDGAEHRATRARLEPPFGAERVNALGPEIAALAERHVAGWPVGRPFRLLERMRTLMQAIFVREVLGVRDEARADALAAAVGNVLRTPGNPPLTPPDRDQQRPLGPAIHRLFERRLAPVRELLSEAAAAGEGQGALLERVSSTDELFVVLAAAQEPPSIAHTWVVDRLARDGSLRDSALADPALFDAVVNETLRLRPPAMASLRRLTAPIEVAGHELAAGTDVMVSIPLIQRDPGVFSEPHRFRPERFLDGPPPAALFPFGGGERRCPAEALAWAQLRAVVPVVLERLHLRPAWPRPERPVQRATVLVPHRSGLMVAARAFPRPSRVPARHG